jgi:DNA invertase Pin-like site-specific DNA recombinase
MNGKDQASGTKHPGGRPRVRVHAEQVTSLRARGATWREIAKALGIGMTTAKRLYAPIRKAAMRSKTLPEPSCEP